MISLLSYLRLPDESFMPVEECTQAPPDADYVEGAIELTIDWQPIVTLDQPLVLRLERLGKGSLLVTCGERKAATREAEFVTAVRREGLRFFMELDRLLPGNAGRNAEAVKSLTAARGPRPGGG
ncbi:hypothetical protein ACFFV7_35875 [Nonomuraea spiralis]|uniref:Uncharacterized protein n=1 Tax=Nonomuraea spiralis TaxID=46182 RepID=A0ABV5IRI6_9ACTN|nr:hypothetical protein [Nonomuraea spiralis]GGT11294.1 hypothetical protein GCM10010176_064870 [Nonomuraea spiralis]